jgi:hypothetical protein
MVDPTWIDSSIYFIYLRYLNLRTYVRNFQEQFLRPVRNEERAYVRERESIKICGRKD